MSLRSVSPNGEFNPHDNTTSDGVVITLGMWVTDYDRRLGKVVGDTTSNIRHDGAWCHDDHWFEVEHPDGSTGMFNGTRLLSRPQR